MFGDGKPSQGSTPAGRTTPAPATAATVSTRGAAPQRPVARASTAAVTQDYQYVIKDLRHLGILAVAVFGVLVALGLILR